VSIDSDNSLVQGSYPQDHIIGYTPPGASIDPGGMSFATDPVVATMPDVRALQLRASPDAISTALFGTTVDYVVDHALPMSAGSTTAIGVVAFGNSKAPPVDLAVLGAPGCFVHLGAVALSLPFAGAASPQAPPLAVALPLPPALPPGTLLYAQAVAVALGSNFAGVITSNAVETVVSVN
jgi:hypothetical protein